MPVDFGAILARDAQLRLLPSVVSYSRLEPVNLSSGDLGPGLTAPVADPLWMVGRQWQFEELRGEDGGSPVLVEIAEEHAGVTRFQPGAPPDQSVPSVDLPTTEGGYPIEVAVEAEQPDVLPERVRAHLGSQLLRLVAAAGLPRGVQAKVREACLEEWPFPDGPVDPTVDPVGTARRHLYRGRIPDGSAAASALAQRIGPNGAVRSLPPALRAAAASHRKALLRVLSSYLAWADGYVAAPLGDSWSPHRLEYRFAARAPLPSGEVVLRADEFDGGKLDWFSFDAGDGDGAVAGGGASGATTQVVMPAPVRYAGMPSDRLWAFEDNTVFLGGLSAGATDLARLALVEFALVFGNDWFVVPVELPYGTVARVRSLSVTDTFGKQVAVPPTREVGRPGWTAFQNTPVDDPSALADLFVVPATLPQPLEGEPLEEVALFRDEMANLVWGVEHVVQGATGEPVRRGLVESRSLRQELPGDLADAAIVYRLMTPVPDNWIPFVSVPVPGLPVARFATELERRPMVRFVEDGTEPGADGRLRTRYAAEVVEPEGVLLRDPADGSGRLRIAEEEVPREGVEVVRRFRLARTPDGGTVLWIARRKGVGQGEGSSGLKFDTALPPGGL